MRVEHTLDPVYTKESRTLILGSMPSVTSRTLGKYYGHKSNRFWPVLYAIYGEKPETDWRIFIKRHKLALWDVIATCEIDASSDSSIKDIVPNDIESLLDKTKIVNIFVLGNKAYELYNKYIRDKIKIDAILLPSTSSANARFRFDDLVEAFTIIKDLTEKK